MSRTLTAAVVALFAADAAHAVNLTASDPFGSSSFNTGLNWSDALAPSAGKNYNTGAFQLRSTTSGTPTFAGDSLSIDAGGTFLLKSPGAHTINNLILNGGSIIHGDVGGSQIGTVAGNINVAANSVLNASVSGRTLTINSVISGSSNLTINPAVGDVGTVILNGNNNAYSGIVTVNTGILTITNSNALGATGAASDTHINGGNGSTGTTLVLSAAALTLGETLNFNANAAGRSGLTNNNAFNQVLNGPIDVSSTGNLVQWNSSGSGSVTINGDITGTMTGGSLLFLRGGSTSVNNRVLGSINLTGGNLAKTDDGMWTIGNAGETYSWNNTQVARGTLRLNLADMLPSATSVSVGQGTDTMPATLDLRGFSQTIGGLTKQGNGTNKQVTNTSATAAVLTINNAAANTYAGRINGNLGLIKTGAGTFTLTDANAYTGTTLINQGVLSLTGSGSIDNSPVIDVGLGATFNVSGVAGYDLVSGQSLIGNGTIVGNVISDPGSTIAPGNSIGLLTFNNNLDIDGLLEIEIDKLAGTVDMIDVLGNLDITGATVDFSLVNATPVNETFVFAKYGSLTGTFADLNVLNLPDRYYIHYAFQGNQIALVAMPEPASLMLLAFGGAALLRRRRR